MAKIILLLIFLPWPTYNLPRSHQAHVAQVSPTPQPTAQPTAVKSAGGLSFGLPGQIQCYNCAPFTQKVHLTNYDPMAGPINCYDYQDGYCWSPTASGIHWKALWGFGAACPPEWPYGTWVDIPGVGAFVCFDRGGSIGCNVTTGVCAVDILGPSGQWWNLQTFTATLWVPLNPPRSK